MGTLDVNELAKPKLIDFDNILLKQFLEAETKLWRMRCSGIAFTDRDSPSKDSVATLLRHGKVFQDIHDYFQKLIPRRYLMKLAGCKMEPDEFQVVPLEPSITFKGTQISPILYKESEKQLLPKEYDIYKYALFAVHYPVLVSSQDSLLDCSTQEPAEGDRDLPGDPMKRQRSYQRMEPRLTPASQECMLIHCQDPISPTSVFPIDSDVLSELLRKAFCLTQRRHTIYKNLMVKIVNNDPAKILLQEMSEQLTILKNGWHPISQPNIFYNKDDYKRWLEKEISEIEKIIEQQEKLVQTPVKQSLTTIPHHFNDKHQLYNGLLVKLFKVDSSNLGKNIATDEAIPTKPLSAEPSRLLNEFGERYRIGELYRRISLLDYLARNFEIKAWYCKHVTSVIESILQRFSNGECYVMNEEIRMFKNAVENLNDHVKHGLSRINRLFPKNTPDGGLRALIDLLSMLVVVDQNEIFGEQNGKSVTYYLQEYVQEEMRTNYERQKFIIANQLKTPKFAQAATPRMVNLIMLDISEKMRNYRMFFKKEFIEYFDIVEMAVKTFYSLSMEDVLELCETHPVNSQDGNIDYPMIALAYRLSSFDRDLAWEDYLSFEEQTWRLPFLKHSLSWMTSLKHKLKDLVTMALQQDSWTAANIQEKNPVEESSPQRERNLNPATRTISGATLYPPTCSPFITPSANSAFVQVNSRQASTVVSRTSSDTPRSSPGALEEFNPPKPDDSCVIPAQSTSQFFSQTSDIPHRHGSKQSNCATCGKVPKMVSGLTAASDCCSEGPIVHSRDSPTPERQDTFMSVDSQASETSSEYADARSHVSDLEDMMSQYGNDVTEVATMAIDCAIPVSSSLIDMVSCMNRAFGVVCHFAKLLCPNTTVSHDPLRLSPDGRSEMTEQLTEGRVNLAKELAEMLGSAAIFYGYQVLCAESCGMEEDTLREIIGGQCLDGLLSQLQDSDVRMCRHNTAGVTRCNTADSQGNFVPPCPGIHRIQNSITQCENLVNEMCVRVNNVRTIKNLLASLIETAVQSVLEPCSRSDIEHDVIPVRETPSTSSTCNQTPSTSSTCNQTPSTSSTCNQNGKSFSAATTMTVQSSIIVETNSITETIEELQQIEDGLVKLMAYRANAVVKKLLQLLLTLNLRNFTYHERLRPVLNAIRRTIQTLASNLYRDCYAAALHHFWLDIVKNFEEEAANLVFLHGTAKDQAALLLQAVSLFVEVFRAQDDVISLTVISKYIEPVLQSLDFYTLPTSSLIEMFEALRMRNDGVVLMTKDSDIRILTRYQQPSEVLIRRLRIELHSESPYFSGYRFVECVVDHICNKGNLKLGICVSQDASNEDCAVILGQYLLDYNIVCFYGKIVAKISEDFQESSVSCDIDEDLKPYNRQGSNLIISGSDSPDMIFNEMPVCKGTDVPSLPSTIVRADSGEGSKFSDSKTVLYKFQLSDVEESFHIINEEYQVTTSDNKTRDDLFHVLFTRRNTDREANRFLEELGENDVLRELLEKYALHHHSIMNCCIPRATPA